MASCPNKLVVQAWFLCALIVIYPICIDAQPSISRTHAFPGTAFAVSHAGDQVAILDDGLCIHSLTSSTTVDRCVEFEHRPRNVVWSVSDSLLAVSGPLAEYINEAVWIVDPMLIDGGTQPVVQLYTSPTGGPGVSYAHVERWLSNRLLVIDNNRGGKLLLDAEDGSAVTGCGFVYVEGKSSFVRAQERWLGMGHSGRINEIQIEDQGGELTFSCTTRDNPAPQTWLRFEDAFDDGRLLFSEQVYDRGTQNRLGADLLVTSHDMVALERLQIGAPASISPQGDLIASIKIDENGTVHLLITEIGYQTVIDLPLGGYDPFGLSNDFSYDRFTPSWSLNGKHLMVPTAIAPGGLPGVRLLLVSLENRSATPILDGIGMLTNPDWLSGDRFVVRRESGIAGRSGEIWVYQVSD